MSKRFFIKVEVNKEEKSILVSQLEIPEGSKDNFDLYNKHVADLVDFATFGVYDYDNDVVAIVDDEGLLKAENLVYEVTFDGKVRQLAGDMLIGKNERREGELYTVGFTQEEMYKISQNQLFKIRAIGMTA